MAASIRNNIPPKWFHNPIQTSRTLAIGTFYLRIRHFNFFFSKNNPNYVVFLGNFQKDVALFFIMQNRKFWNFVTKNFLSKLTWKTTICFSLFVFRVQSVNKVCWWFCFKIFGNVMKKDCIMPYSSLIQLDLKERGFGTLNKSILIFSWYSCNCLR